MASYWILEAPDGGEAAPTNAAVIRDGFSILALFFPLVWFLWHRMWFEALVLLGISVLLGMVASIPGFEAVAVLGIFIAVLAGFEAQNLRAASLRRKGWTDWGVIVASSREEAEMRYLGEAMAGRQQVDEVSFNTGGGPAQRPSSQHLQLGLIDYPRKA